VSLADLQHPALMAESILAASALLLALLDATLWPRRPSRAASWAALCVLLVALAVSLRSWGGTASSSWLRADAAASLGDLLVLSGAVLAALLAVGTPASLRRAGSPILLLLATLGGCVAVGAADLPGLFVGLELAGLSVMAYQALDEAPGERRGVRAALRWAGPAGSATALTAAGAALLWAAAGSSRLADLGTGAGETGAIGAALLLAGLAVRVGAVPFHAWLADVLLGSAPSAALLTLSAGVLPALLVLGHLAGGSLDQLLPDLPLLLTILGVLSACMGGLLLLPQRRLRRILACAVVAQVGFVLAGIATHAGEEPFSGTMWLQLAALLPAVAGCLAVSGLSGAGLGATASGLARQHPGKGALLCLFLVALAGLPPTLAFAGRSALFLALAEGGWSLVLGAASLLLAYGLLRVAARVLFDDAATSAVPPASAGTVAAAVLSAAVLLAFGLWPLPLGEAAVLAAGAG
jgi:NADH-quinone oxidoreductase subunit N